MTVRQYVGARYVPKFYEFNNGVWQSNTEYEPLTIVQYNNNSYTSKKTVPANIGNPSENPTYWVNTGNYNAQVEAYRQEVANLSNDISKISVYVTPEMYGAIGDGVSNDYQALQDAIDSGYNVVIPNKTYNIENNTLIIESNNQSNIYAAGSTIKYIGTDYAIRFRRINQKNVKLGNVVALSGSCIDIVSTLYSLDNKDRVQYLNIEFDSLKALNNCIHGEAAGNPSWVNEIRISKGRFEAGTNGILLERSTTNAEINGWRFDDIAFEGVTNGLVLSSSNGDIDSISLTNVRVMEQPDKIVKTTGGVYDVFFSTSDQMSEQAFDLSVGTRQMVIEGPLFEGAAGGGNPISFYTRVGRNNVKLYNIPKTLTVTYESGTVNTEYSRICVVDQICYVNVVLNGVTLAQNAELFTLPVAPSRNTYINDLTGRKWRMLNNGKLVTDTALDNTAVFLEFSFPIYVNYS